MFKFPVKGAAPNQVPGLCPQSKAKAWDFIYFYFLDRESDTLKGTVCTKRILGINPVIRKNAKKHKLPSSVLRLWKINMPIRITPEQFVSLFK